VVEAVVAEDVAGVVAEDVAGVVAEDVVAVEGIMTRMMIETGRDNGLRPVLRTGPASAGLFLCRDAANGHRLGAGGPDTGSGGLLATEIALPGSGAANSSRHEPRLNLSAPLPTFESARS
jgi:hypothetical protein